MDNPLKGFDILKKTIPINSTFKKMLTYFLVLIIIVFLTTAIFLLLDFYNITSYIGLTQNYDWLGFFGGFLGGTFGGVATFLGVYFTLQHQKHSDDEKNRLYIIPILEYKISTNESDFDNSAGQLYGEGGISHINIGKSSYQDPKSIEWYFNLLFSNVGMGHAQVTGIDFIIGDSNHRFIQKEAFGFSYKLVKKEEKASIKFMIYAPNKDFDNDVSKEEILYSIKVIIRYQDLLGNKYEQQINASIASSNQINFADFHSCEVFKHTGK